MDACNRVILFWLPAIQIKEDSNVFMNQIFIYYIFTVHEMFRRGNCGPYLILYCLLKFRLSLISSWETR